MDATRKLVEVRTLTHGDWERAAVIMDDTLEIWSKGLNWNSMSPGKRVALIEIAHKVSRILEGNPNLYEHWDDLAGYSQLGKR
jgi:hypothetical protein